MSEAVETKKTEPIKAESKITLGMDELRSLIATSVAEAVTQATKVAGNVMAEAILEARKPYVDPRQVENEEMMREQMRQSNERINHEIELSRESCAHLQGSNALSEFQGQLGSFVLHQLDTGVVVGICTNCQKQIWSNDPKDQSWFSKKSANRMSRAGQRVFLDPLKAQRAR